MIIIRRINLGRCSLETMKKSADVFITEFSSQIGDLIPHDFISKKQAAYLKKRKESLGQGEFIVISDFAENYSFVVQVSKILYRVFHVMKLTICHFNEFFL